jgi:PKD repeat protein
VKTNETGEASVQLSIPEAAESANIDGQVYIQYNNEIIRDDLYAPIEKYNINFDVEDVAPGEETTLSVEATDRTTDTVVSNIPLQYNALYSGSGVASYARGELETGQSGTDSTTIAVPEDLAPDRAINYISRYASLGLYRVNMYDFPGSIEISSSGETDYGQPVAAPGEEISIEFTTPDSTDPTGLVFAEFGHNADAGARGTVIKSISASQDGTLTVPDYAGNDSYVSITVWAATSSDNFYAADQAIEIQTTADEGGGSNGDVPPIVGSNPPTDTTGDGTLNDINGDGEFDIVDVSAFFQNRQGDAVQNNTDLFDFNGDGEISIIDVQALLQQL